jgi:AraC-like DNA-binding protein
MQRAPAPPLAGLVSSIWLSRGGSGGPELAIPSGAMHLAVRLSEAPIRLGEEGASHGHAVLAGARATPWIRESPADAVSAGVVLRPGAAALFGLSAEEIAGRHVPLDGWDLRHAADPLAALEARLIARLPPRPVHPAVRMAVRRLAGGDSVADVVEESGYSARGFLAIFRAAVGLSPKLYARLQRFQRVIRRVAARPAPFGDVAREHGYADQSHLVRDFVAFTGAPPTVYAPRAPDSPNHARLPNRPSGPRARG